MIDVEKADMFVNEYTDFLFDKFDELILIASVKTNEGFFIELNVDIKKTLSLKDKEKYLTAIIAEIKSYQENKLQILQKKYASDPKEQKIKEWELEEKHNYNETDLIIKESRVFSPSNSSTNSELSTYNVIRNRRNGNFAGMLGAIFTYKKENYLLTNHHVIGRIEMFPYPNEIIQKKINSKLYEDIGNYLIGDITNRSDYAIATISKDVIIEKKTGQDIEIGGSVNFGDVLIIDEKKVNVLKSKKASFKIKDNYFYKKERRLKDQILIDTVYGKGNSGLIALNKNGKAVGMLVASNDRYTALNKIKNVIIDLEKKSNTSNVAKVFRGVSSSEIQIFNHN